MLEVDVCPQCRGMWLDVVELDRPEDMVFDEDDRKGSLIHFQTKTMYPCPHCETNLEEFQYRLYDLKLEYCAENAHGFWLDSGEDERVMDIMRRRACEMKRKIDVELQWRQTLKDMHSFFKRGK